MSMKMMLYAEILRQLKGIKDFPAQEPEMESESPDDESEDESDDMEEDEGEE